MLANSYPNQRPKIHKKGKSTQNNRKLNNHSGKWFRKVVENKTHLNEINYSWIILYPPELLKPTRCLPYSAI